MATIQPTLTVRDNGIVVAEWSGLGQGDDGAPIQMPNTEAHKCFQAFGNFSGTPTVNLEGSNADSGEFSNVSDDPGNSDIAATDNSLFFFTGKPLRLRPNVTSGDGSTDLTVRIVAKAEGK